MTSFPQPAYSLNDIHNELKKDQQIWDLYTKKDEYTSKKLDRYDRVSYKSSCHENILIPSVSEYLVKKGFHTEYKDGKKFAIFLSHDIDDINISNRQLFRSIIPFPFHRDHLGSMRFISSYLKKEKPYINFKKIIEIEKKYDATSTFFFLTTNEDIFGKKYQLEEIQDEINYILNHECEIGLHTGFFSFDDLQKIKIEKEKLERISRKKVAGVRNHVYRFKIPGTWRLLSQAGFEYDSTFGYYDMMGFRNGICHPFKPYDLDENKIIDIIEIPPCIIDVTMFSYMKFDASKAWIYIKNLIDAVEKLGGVLTILWHNWAFSYPVSYSGLFGKEWTRLYEKILKYSYKKNAWLTSGRNISDFILKNY
jgi:peptidoglycan/xylan/chitin deacetylase (PgdA/CDA1 family)